MKKSTLAIIAVVIIIIILLLLRGCDSFRRTPENEIAEIDLTQYRTPFVEANIDFSCLIIEDNSIIKDNILSKEKLNESYANHQLPINDDPLMIQILNLYENDSSVIQEIRNGVKSC